VEKPSSRLYPKDKKGQKKGKRGDSSQKAFGMTFPLSPRGVFYRGVSVVKRGDVETSPA